MDQYKNPALSPEIRAKDLLSKMTLEEKIAQINILRGVEYFEEKDPRSSTCTVEPGEVFKKEDFRATVADRGIGYIHDIYSLPEIKN